MKIKENFDIPIEYRGDNASALAEELYLEQQKKKESKNGKRNRICSWKKI